MAFGTFFVLSAAKLVTLPHDAVLAVFAKQQEMHGELLAAARARRSHRLEPGDLILVADGGSYSGLVAPVDRISSRGRIEELSGMIRHSLPAS